MNATLVYHLTIALQNLAKRGIAVGTILIVAACQTASPAPQSSATPAGRLTPYHTATPSRTAVPPTPLAELPITPAPTATPFLHVIKLGDTMGAIAYRYGVSLEELQAANPSVDPGFLIVDQTLVIPLGEDSPGTIPTTAPVPVELAEPTCYPTRDNGVWCFILAHNPHAVAAENVAAWVGLFNSTGENVGGQTATAPLNLLNPGQSLPLAVFFSGPLPPEVTARRELLAALPVDPASGRYLEVTVQVEDVVIGAGGREAQVTGKALFWANNPTPRLLWLAAVAFDAQGNVVGLRKWEAPAEWPCAGFPQPDPVTPTLAPPPDPQVTAVITPTLAAPATPGPLVECLPYELSVFSLGGPIERVEVWGEARP